MEALDIKEINILITLGILLGGMIMGILANRKLPLTRNSKAPAPANIAISQKTAGAMHISEEALSKMGDLKATMEGEYLKEKTHELICRAVLAELANQFSGIVQKKIDASETKILDAIKDNGK